jgi:hypothetical protein
MPYAGNSKSWDWAAVSESRSRMFGRHWWAIRQKLTTTYFVLLNFAKFLMCRFLGYPPKPPSIMNL